MIQIRQTLAIAKADLISTFRNGSSVFFGLLFPFIFIFVFGSLGTGSVEYDVGVYDGTSKDNFIYATLDEIEAIALDDSLSTDEIQEGLEKGSLQGAIQISDQSDGGPPTYQIAFTKSAVEEQEGAIIQSILDGIIDKSNLQLAGVEQGAITLKIDEVQGREFKQIDFILPGQLAFALLSSGVFGTAFLLVSLKETLVLKRFFATPIKRYTLILGLALSKLAFALLQATVIIVVGKYMFDFTLLNGFWTFIQMIIVCTFALSVFLGFGLVVSSISKDENAVPPLANIFTLPQFLLAGTFFPIEYFPEWLQPVSKALPLTYLNEALREISFEGASIASQVDNLIPLVIWGVIVYFVSFRLFSWE